MTNQNVFKKLSYQEFSRNVMPGTITNCSQILSMNLYKNNCKQTIWLQGDIPNLYMSMKLNLNASIFYQIWCYAVHNKIGRCSDFGCFS